MSDKNQDKKEVVLSKDVHQLSKGLAVEVKKSRMKPEYDVGSMVAQMSQHYKNIAALEEGIAAEKLKIEKLQEIINNLGK